MFLNPNDKGTTTVLTDSFLTATQTHGSDAWQSVRGIEPKLTGKYYFEVEVITLGGFTNNLLIGIATHLATLDNYFGRNNHAFVYTDDGRHLFQNVNVGSGETYTDGDIICGAVDFDNDRIWFRKNGGNWNNSAPADPDTNVGGRDISAMPGIAKYIAIGLFYDGASVKLNAGSSPFAFTKPANFDEWGLVQPQGSTAMRYWRVAVDRTNTNTFTSLGEIEGRTAAAGAQQLTGGTESQDSTPFAGEEADKALDGNAGTRSTFGAINSDGAGAQTLPHGWQYDFGAGNNKKIVEAAITCRSDGFANAAPNTFRFMCSTDGVHWIVRHREAAQSAWGLGEQRVFGITDLTYPSFPDELHPPQIASANVLGQLSIGLEGALFPPQIASQNQMGSLVIGLTDVDRLFPDQIQNQNQMGLLEIVEIAQPVPYTVTTVVMS